MNKYLLLLICLTCSVASMGQYRFIENKGQWDKQALYRAELPGGFLFVEKASLTYLLYDLTTLTPHVHNNTHTRQANEGGLRGQVVKMNLLGANAKAIPAALEPFDTHYNFFLGNDQSQWAGGAKAYYTVELAQVYPRIKMRMGQQEGFLKYEFEVAPGGQPAKIKMQYQGHSHIQINEGKLLVKTDFSHWEEKAPYCYQVIENEKRQVKANFVLEGNTVSFEFPEGYDKRHALVIDPTLVFSTYSSSSQDNWGFTATYDEKGCLYSAGMTRLTGSFPTTPGAFQGSPINTGEDITDIGILKFDPSGRKLLHATYLGGTQTDIPHSMLIDEAGRLVILGTTSSSNFPTSNGAFDRSFNGGIESLPLGSGIHYVAGSDIFVTALDSTGRTLQASTFIGGSDNDGLHLASRVTIVRNYGDQFRGDLIADSQNNLYVVSVSRSRNFPTTSGAIKSSLSGSQDAVVFKMPPSFSSLLWSTYIGGNGDEGSYSIKLDKANNPIICGGTTSSNFPTSFDAIHTTRPGGIADGFVARIATDGTSILNATYLGTNLYDQAYLLDLDENDNVVVFGQTYGAYPVSASNLFQNPNSGQFLHKLNISLNQTIFSTVFGSNSNTNANTDINISPTAFLVSDCGQIFLSGWGGVVNQFTDPEYVAVDTKNMPTTPDDIPATRTNSDGSDFYFMVLSADAKRLIYGTYMGGDNSSDGDHVDGGTSRFDKRGVIYHAACVCRFNDFPATPNAFGGRNGALGLCNNVAFKFDFESVKSKVDPFIGSVRDTDGCAPLDVRFAKDSIAGKTIVWDFGDGKSSTFNTVQDVTHTYTKPGTYTVSVTAIDSATCQISVKSTGTITVFPANFSITGNKNICIGDTVQLEAAGAVSYKWTPAASLNSSQIANPLAFPTANTTYRAEMVNEFGCKATLSVDVSTGPLSKLDAGLSVKQECNGMGQVIFFNKTQGVGEFFWIMPNGDTVKQTTPEVFIPLLPGKYKFTLIGKGGVCAQNEHFEADVYDVGIPPNIITPNGDGKNDTFVLTGAGPGWKFHVYNRWGHQIYASDNYKNDWSSEGLGGEGYYYLLTSPSGHSCKGILQVMK